MPKKVTAGPGLKDQKERARERKRRAEQLRREQEGAKRSIEGRLGKLREDSEVEIVKA